MSVASKLQSPISEPRAVLGPGGNRVRVLEGPKRKDDGAKKPPQQTPRPRKPVPELPEPVVRSDVSVDSTCSSDTSSSGYSAKTASPGKIVRRKSLRPAKVASDDAEVAKPAGPPKRCEWITPHAGKICCALFSSLSGVWLPRKLIRKRGKIEMIVWKICLNLGKNFKLFSFAKDILELLITCI